MIRRTIMAVQELPFFVQSIRVTVDLTKKEKDKIKKYLKDNSFGWQIKKRLEAIRLLGMGLSPQLVAKQLCVRLPMVYMYVKQFRKGNINSLLEMDKSGKETKLTENMIEKLERYIEESLKSGIKLSNLEKTKWLQKNYNIIIGEAWLSKRLAMRKKAVNQEPWR